MGLSDPVTLPRDLKSIIPGTTNCQEAKES